MSNKNMKAKQRKNRHNRVRTKIFGTPERPRLNIYKSNQNIYAQLVDDVNGTTLASASTLDKELGAKGCNVESAKVIGEAIGKRALDKGIEEIVFDRSGYIYHGRVKALAEAARDAGLKF